MVWEFFRVASKPLGRYGSTRIGSIWLEVGKEEREGRLEFYDLTPPPVPFLVWRLLPGTKIGSVREPQRRGRYALYADQFFSPQPYAQLVSQLTLYFRDRPSRHLKMKVRE